MTTIPHRELEPFLNPQPEIGFTAPMSWGEFVFMMNTRLDSLPARQEASGMQVGARAPQAARAILLTP